MQTAHRTRINHRYKELLILFGRTVTVIDDVFCLDSLHLIARPQP